MSRRQKCYKKIAGQIMGVYTFCDLVTQFNSACKIYGNGELSEAISSKRSRKLLLIISSYFDEFCKDQ